MKFVIAFFSVFSIGLSCVAQVSYDFKKYDFGEIDRESQRWVDLEVENKSNKDIYILRVESPRSVTYKVSSSTIKAKDKGYIRLFINPFSKGDFKEEIAIWTSDAQTPQKVILKATIKETNTLSLQSCPDFGDVNPYKIGFDLEVYVKTESGERVEGVNVVLARSAKEAYKGETNKKGKLSVRQASIGLYRVQASHQGKIVFDQMVYFNRQDPYHTIILKGIEEIRYDDLAEESKEETKQNMVSERAINNTTKTTSKEKKVKSYKTEETIISVSDDRFSEGEEGPLKQTQEPQEEKITGISREEYDIPHNSTSYIDAAIEAELKKLDTVSVSSSMIDDAIARELEELELEEMQREMDSLAVIKKEQEQLLLVEEAKKDPEGFSRIEYAPNNIVFLIDVSTSMRYLERIDLLKFAMIELSSILRDIDYVSVVTYASHAQVRLNPTQGTNKTSIDSLIWSLEARGTTASDKGLDKAYELAKQSFKVEGNNQIFLVTDGAFEARPLYRMIRTNAKEQIFLSVLGVKANREIVPGLTEMSEIGQGTFVNITDLNAAQTVLVEEIKKNSKKP